MEERVEQVEKRVKALEARLDVVEDDVELCVSQDELNEGDRKIERTRTNKSIGTIGDGTL